MYVFDHETKSTNDTGGLSLAFSIQDKTKSSSVLGDSVTRLVVLVLLEFLFVGREWSPCVVVVEGGTIRASCEPADGRVFLVFDRFKSRRACARSLANHAAFAAMRISFFIRSLARMRVLATVTWTCS